MAKVRGNLRNLLIALDKEKEEEKQDMGVRFISDLYNSIKIDAQKEIKVPSAKFKPSSMKCCRNMQYQIMQVEPEKEDISAEMVGILESGTDRHLRIQTAITHMKENGFDCEYLKVGDYVRNRQQNGQLLDLEIVNEEGIETKLYNKKWNISFMCDGLILFHNKYYILEIKTETTIKNQKRTNMDENHIPQICAYYLSFGIPDVMMLYENRDILQKKAYCVTVTDQMVFENVISKIETVNTAISLGELAPTHKSTNCNYCSYRNRCKRDGELSA